MALESISQTPVGPLQSDAFTRSTKWTCRFRGLQISFSCSGLNVAIEECFVFVFHKTKVDFIKERSELNDGGKEEGLNKSEKQNQYLKSSTS